jgi:hypothetical protein
MDFETLKRYKDLFIESYDYSHQTDGVVWFHDVQLKELANVSFHFADSVVFDYTEDVLDISIYQERLSEPIEIKNLI